MKVLSSIAFGSKRRMGSTSLFTRNKKNTYQNLRYDVLNKYTGTFTEYVYIYLHITRLISSRGAKEVSFEFFSPFDFIFIFWSILCVHTKCYFFINFYPWLFLLIFPCLLTDFFMSIHSDVDRLLAIALQNLTNMKLSVLSQFHSRHISIILCSVHKKFLSWIIYCALTISQVLSCLHK